MQVNPLEAVIQQKLEAFVEICRSAPSQGVVEEKSAQLTVCTKDPSFLEVAHKLLTTPGSFPNLKKDKETMLTSLLKDKFKFEYETIGANIQVHYKQLIQIVQHHQHTTYAIYTNIALALAYAYLHLLVTQPTSLEAFLQPLTPSDSSNIRLFNYYFKTLEYIATEIDNNKFVIDQIQRESARQNLVTLQVSVLQGLDSIAGKAFETPEINKENVFQCFEAWITVNYNPELLNSLPNHTLFQKMIQHLQDEDCGEGANNCFRSIIYQLKNQEENKGLFETLSTCSLEILNLIDNNIKDLEFDKAEEFMRIVADFARKSKKMFVSHYDSNVESFLGRLITYIKDDLLNTYETLGDVFEEILLQIQERKKEGVILNPDIYLMLDPLYNSLAHKCQLPVRLIKELNTTDESKAHHISGMAEEIIRNREFTEILFESICEIQGKTNYLEFVFNKIRVLDPSDERNFYPMLQIYLYSIIDAVRKYPTLDNSVVTIVKMYLDLSAGTEPIPICVRRTFLKVFRNLTTSPHKDPEFMYRIMCTTISCFDEPLLFSTAEKTFEKACEENKHISGSIFTEFGPVLEKYPNRSYIVRGLVTMMCNDSVLTSQYLLPALHLIYQKFQVETNKSLRKEYMYSLVQALKTFKDSPTAKENMHILQQFTREIWSSLMQILGTPQRVKDDEDSEVEKIVRIIKYLMRTLEFQFSQFLEGLFSTVLTAFQQYPICSYVYLVEVAVTVYSSNPAYTDYLRRLYSDFCDIVFLHMKQIDDLGRFSYLLDDYMGMNKRFFLYNASIVLTSTKLPTIIETSMSGFMGCDVPRVAKSAYSFFETIFMVYWPIEHLNHRNSKEDVTPITLKPEDAQSYQALKEFLVQKMEEILSKMLLHLGTAPTEQTRDYILDALVSQVKGFIPENPAIWTRLLSRMSAQILVQQQKQRMIEMLESLNGSTFQASRKIVKSFDKMLVLMNRRMNNSNNRKNIHV